MLTQPWEHQKSDRENYNLRFNLKRFMLRILIKFILLFVVVYACENKAVNDEKYHLVLETIAKGDNIDYIWSHARTAIIPSDTPLIVTTTSKTLKKGSDVYHDLYELRSTDMGKMWSGPDVIESLKVYNDSNGYRSMADMWPQWHSGSQTVLNIGTAPFYTGNKTHDSSKKEITYAVYNPASSSWGPPQKLNLPERDNDSLLLLAPAAGSAQWLELSNGDVLLPVFYFKISDSLASVADKETFSIKNLMNSNMYSFATTVLLCSFDGEKLAYKRHGDELTLKQGRGIYEPSLACFKGTYYLTLRSDKSAYVTKSPDGLHFEPIKEWAFNDGTILGSYNTQQHWVTRNEALYLVYTRKGADNDHVFRHRAPLFMAEVDVDKLQVIRNTEKIAVPNRGVDLGNFGVSYINENETWITVAEYTRNEKNVDADNSIFISRIIWNQ